MLRVLCVPTESLQWVPSGYLEALEACQGPVQAHGNSGARKAGTAPSHGFPEEAGRGTERKRDRSSPLQPEPQGAGGSGAGGFPRVAKEPEHYTRAWIRGWVNELLRVDPG